MENQLKGVCFQPSAEELIQFLAKKANGEPLQSGFLKECDLYGEKEPWLIFDKFSKQDNYVFTLLKKKSRSRVQRTAGSGTWVGQRTDKVYDRKNQHIGFKKLLIFEGAKGSGLRDKDRKDGHWIMHEFSLLDQDQQYVVCKIRNSQPQPQPPQQEKKTDFQAQPGPQTCRIAPPRLKPPLVRVTDFKDLGLDNNIQQHKEETQPQQPKRRRISGIAPVEQPQQLANYMNLRVQDVCQPREEATKPQPKGPYDVTPAEKPQLAADHMDLRLHSTCQSQEEIAPPLQRSWTCFAAGAEGPQPIADNMDFSSCNVCQTEDVETEPQLSMLQTNDFAPPEQPQPAADYMDFGLLHSIRQPQEKETAPQLQNPWTFDVVPAEEPTDYMDFWDNNLCQTEGEAELQPNMLSTSNIAPPEQPQPVADYMDSWLHVTCQPQEEETAPQFQRPWTCDVIPEEEPQSTADCMDLWVRNLSQTQESEAEPQLHMLPTGNIAPPEEEQPVADYMNSGLQSTCQPQEDETSPELPRASASSNYMDFWLSDLPAANSLFLDEAIEID